MAALAADLAAIGVASLRFQFPYREQGRTRPDLPALCHATIRAAVAKAHALAPTLPLFAGGKSFGGRMTSQAQANEPLAHVLGLVFFGFPLHPAKCPSSSRADHLARVKIPMQFLQGDRDALADLAVLEPVTKRLGERCTLVAIRYADHSFHVPVRSGRTDDEVKDEMIRSFSKWVRVITDS